ncbi:hypothetical protein J2X32_000568 [Rheinheimera pacifica]|uniref:ParB N-terminal domain-containing protein n=1 Tax=Rheinheimera pacifica TaxID=173990 RepID=UPI00286292B7|nr:ParB N-terminal domain-containing protein [Rheinheimera pacifica]MDR6981960.1 hypothetical protein [Rheinheimera pacifica]
MSKYEWLEKKSLRSVDQLRLWPQNPRLDPEEKHSSLSDYITDLMNDSGEKDDFFKLISSIAMNGYIPADPIVVWQDGENDRYYVAEGNRRVLALKLLRNPNKAPKSIRAYVRQKANLIDRDSIEKIRVSVAPSFDDCEWYINQRHFNGSLQRPWSRLQQQRWIAELYDKYEGDVSKVTAITNTNKSSIESTLRILKIRDLALNPAVMNKLTEDEAEKVRSHRVPMTIFERFFFHPLVKEKWGIDFNEDKVHIRSNESSFYSAYAAWLKNVIHRDEPGVVMPINTRTITSELGKILESLPQVSFEPSDSNLANESSSGSEYNNPQPLTGNAETEKDKPKRPVNRNPDRNQIVIDTCKLKTSNFKLDSLFREFKQLPVYKYKNIAAVGLRVFLDIAIAEFLIAEGKKEEIAALYRKDFREVTLKQRLDYVKKNYPHFGVQAIKVIDKLLNSSNDFSLDTLNNYVHGSDTHHTERRFLNGFWDFLFPLLEKLIDIEVKE